MSRWVAAAAVVGIFLSGLVIGVAGTHLFYVSRLRHPGGPPMMAAEFFSARLERQLRLSPEQAEELDRVIAESRRAGAELREEMGPRVRALMERTSSEIEAILTEEQRREFDRMRRFQRRRFEGFLLGHGPGDPPPRRGHRRPGV